MIMPDTIVPYARFLEIRQRQQRVMAELTRHPVAAPNGDATVDEPRRLNAPDERRGLAPPTSVVTESVK
jgi:hypothetical protein